MPDVSTRGAGNCKSARTGGVLQKGSTIEIQIFLPVDCLRAGRRDLPVERTMYWVPRYRMRVGHSFNNVESVSYNSAPAANRRYTGRERQFRITDGRFLAGGERALWVDLASCLAPRPMAGFGASASLLDARRRSAD